MKPSDKSHAHGVLTALVGRVRRHRTPGGDTTGKTPSQKKNKKIKKIKKGKANKPRETRQIARSPAGRSLNDLNSPPPRQPIKQAILSRGADATPCLRSNPPPNKPSAR